jgi:pimeloyl-ACP methyl ester carboxylesterase
MAADLKKRVCLVASGCVGCLSFFAVGAAVLGAAPPLVAWASVALRETTSAADGAPGTRLELAGEVLHVQQWGPPDGALLLLVPGTSAWAQTWVEVAEPLGNAGFHVVAVDLPPFGYSDPPASADGYVREAQARRILSVLEHFDAQDAVLLGHSFGGGATVEAAMRAPSGTLGELVLLDVALGLGQPPSGMAPWMRLPCLPDFLVALTLSNPLATATGVEVMVADPMAVTPGRVARYQRPLDVRGTTAAIADWLPELLAPTPSWAINPERYRGLAVPTTLIWGEQDTATPLDQAHHILSLVPDSELVTLPGVGHLPQIEDPAGVVRSVLAIRSPGSE